MPLFHVSPVAFKNSLGRKKANSCFFLCHVFLISRSRTKVRHSSDAFELQLLCSPVLWGKAADAHRCQDGTSLPEPARRQIRGSATADPSACAGVSCWLPPLLWVSHPSPLEPPPPPPPLPAQPMTCRSPCRYCSSCLQPPVLQCLTLHSTPREGSPLWHKNRPLNSVGRHSPAPTVTQCHS